MNLPLEWTRKPNDSSGTDSFSVLDSSPGTAIFYLRHKIFFCDIAVKKNNVETETTGLFVMKLTS